jgi:hypothetical protein
MNAKLGLGIGPHEFILDCLRSYLGAALVTREIAPDIRR